MLRACGLSEKRIDPNSGEERNYYADPFDTERLKGCQFIGDFKPQKNDPRYVNLVNERAVNEYMGSDTAVGALSDTDQFNRQVNEVQATDKNVPF